MGATFLSLSSLPVAYRIATGETAIPDNPILIPYAVLWPFVLLLPICMSRFNKYRERWWHFAFWHSIWHYVPPLFAMVGFEMCRFRDSQPLYVIACYVSFFLVLISFMDPMTWQHSRESKAKVKKDWRFLA